MGIKEIARTLLYPRANLERYYREAPGDDDGGDNAEACEYSAPLGARGRVRPRDVITNVPLILGSIIVLALFLLVLVGPVLAPKNPYTAGQHILPHYDAELDQFVAPPLPPSSEYPLGTDQWGQDILSLLMHGARNTLVACAFIAMTRVILGLILGGIAGWNEGKSSDRLIMGSVGVITAVPMLISSMILIYALDIRKGLPVFIIALAVIGWTEIAQYIRSEFLVLRKAPYIEGARAVGMDGLAVAVKHVLPNILPVLLVITFLEMGAVMLLLGELGFVGVYIGGGSRIAITELMAPTKYFTLIEVPEWGAMLAEGFRWLRSKPFVVWPPAIAFFVAVVGFNFLGEGLRRLIEQAGMNTAFLLRRRMLAVIGVITLATIFIINNTGAAPWFAKVAGAFRGDLAYEHARVLSEMDGRGAGQAGGEEAAAYLQDQFEAYGLDPGWKRLSYIYPLETKLVHPLAQPTLAIVDADGRPRRTFSHQLDFGYVIEGHGGSGEARAPLTFVGFEQAASAYDWRQFKGLDLRGRLVLLLEGNAPPDFATEALIRGAEGILWMTDEDRDAVRSQTQLARPQGDYLRGPTLPIFRIRPQVVAALLADDGLSASDLLDQTDSVDQQGEGWFTRDLSTTVQISLALSEPQPAQIPNVIGYKPGSDFDISDELVVLFASYDGLGVDPDGTVYPAANHGATGPAMLLEIARLWQEQGLDPRRSVLFVAWGAGQLDDPGTADYLEDFTSIRHLNTPSGNQNLEVAAVIQMDYLGAGGEALFIDPRSDQALADLLKATTADVGIAVTSDPGDMRPFDDRVTRNIPWLYFAWTDADAAWDEDTFERISADKFQALGEALALALTKAVRESDFLGPQ